MGKKYGVQGFPTLKWFDGKSDKPVDYDGGRDLESPDVAVLRSALDVQVI